MLLGTKTFLQYWFRLWSNCLPVSFPRVLALLLIAAAWTKSFIIIQGAQRNWDLDASGQKSRRLRRKISGTWMMWLGSWSETIPYFWHVHMCGLIHVFTGVDSAWVRGKSLCSAHALNVNICPPTSHLAYPVILSPSAQLCAVHILIHTANAEAPLVLDESVHNVYWLLRRWLGL